MCYVACVTDEDVARRYELVRPHLDEKARRLVLGAEAVALGRGGTKRVAEATGAHPDTVARGRREVQSAEPQDGRIRRPGAGRRPLVETDPGLLQALEALVEPETRGDPMSPLKWTTKSTRNLSEALAGRGHQVSASTVATLLTGELGYSLQGNAKTIEGKQHPDRDAQFGYLNDAGGGAHGRGLPGDQRGHQEEGAGRAVQERWPGMAARRRARAGQGARLRRPGPRQGQSRTASTTWPPTPAGSTWAPTTTPSRSPLQTIRRWWDTVGKDAYPDAGRLLISADGGGSNGYRTRLWKTELAELAAETGLEITVCHLPPGTSQVEQNRAPAVLPHLHELARQATDQPRGHREHHRRDHHPHRAHASTRNSTPAPIRKASRFPTGR